MWEELPASGKPTDYDLISNLKFTAQRLYTTSYFHGETIGDVIANVGMGIKYTQNVHNYRVVKGDTIFAEAISSSSLKSVAEQKYFKGDTILYRPAASIKGENVTWSDNVGKMENDDFFRAYGVIPNELTKYALNNDSIIKVVDNNALEKSAANDDGTGEGAPDIKFDIPSNLVADENGHYSFTVTVDPNEATKFYRNEVRTLAGADQNPVFYSASITVVIDDKWTPISVSTRENYDIAIPVLGAMNCTASLTETFTHFDEDGEVPEKEFFESHIDDAGAADMGGGASPADYLASAFSAYLNGEKDLSLAADVNIGGVKLENLRLSINMKTLDIKAKLDPLAVQYSGDKVYLTLNDIKGYLSVDKFAALMNDPALASLTASLPDFGNLLGDDILSTVFADCDMTSTDGVTCIHLPFSLSEDIEIDASLYIKDEGMELQSIAGTVNAFGIKVELEARPANSSFPVPDDTYKSLDGIIDFIPDALGTIKSKTYAITGNVVVNDMNIGIDAYIDRSAALKAEANVTALGQNISIKYIDDVLYAEVGNIKIKAATADMPEMLEVIKNLTGFDLGALDALKTLLPKTVAGWLETVDTLDVTENSLTLGLNLGAITAGLDLYRADGNLSAADLELNADVLDYKLAADAHFDISTAARPAPVADGDYVDAKELLAIAGSLGDILEQKSLIATISAQIGGKGTKADIALDFSNGVKFSLSESKLGAAITFIDGIAYIKAGGVAVKANVDDIDPIVTAVLPALPQDLLAQLPALDNIDIESLISTALGAVKGLSVSDNSVVLDVATEVNGLTVSAKISIEKDLSTLNVLVKIGDTDAVIAVNDIAAKPVTISAPDGDYADIKELTPLISAIAPLFNKSGYKFSIDAKLFDTPITGSVAVSPATDNAPFALSVNLMLGYDVPVTVKYIGEQVADGSKVPGAIYLDIDNKFKIKAGASSADIIKLIDEMKAAISELKVGASAEIDKIVTVLDRVSNIAGGGSLGIGLADVKDLLSKVSLGTLVADGKSGITLSAEFKGNSLSASIINKDGTLSAFAVSIDVNGKPVAFDAEVTLNNGALNKIVLPETEGGAFSGSVALESTEAQAISVSGDYIDAGLFTKYVRPLAKTVSGALGAKYISLDINALINIDSDSPKHTKAVGRVNIELPDKTQNKTLGVSASINLFAGSAESIALGVIFKDGMLYLDIGGIKLSLNVKERIKGSDGVVRENDLDGIYKILSERNLIPKYLLDELGMMLGAVEGTSAFDSIGLIIDRFTEISQADGVGSVIDLLFSEVGNMGSNGKSDSAVKAILGMIGIGSMKNELTDEDMLVLNLDLMNIIHVSVIPTLTESESDGAKKLGDIELRTNIGSVGIYASAGGFSFSSEGTPINAPTSDGGNGYVSLVEFVKTIDSLIGTFTTKFKPTADALGDITFEINDLNFTYDATYGGTKTPKEGETLDKITVTNAKNDDGSDFVRNSDGSKQSALKGRLVAYKKAGGKTGYRVNLEAHIGLDISSMSAGTGILRIDLYLIDDGNNPATAYLKYYETKTGFGENATIDFKSVLQMVAAAMDIVGAHEAAESLLSDYRLTTDTSVFDSMKIQGFEPIKNMLIDLANKVDCAKYAVKYGKKALDIVMNAGSINNLRAGIPDIKTYVGVAVDSLKGKLPKEDEKGNLIIEPKKPETKPTQDTATYTAPLPSGTMIDGTQIAGILKGIALGADNTHVWANIDNALTVKGSKLGKAKVAVTQSGGMIDSVKVENLDGKNALVTADVKFVSGKEVTVATPDVTTVNEKTGYSDLSQIKHLIFDVMNTANLKEFEIGDGDNDAIDFTLKIGEWELKDVKIKYKVQVKLFDKQERKTLFNEPEKDEKGNPQPEYKTAAYVELTIPYTSVAIDILGGVYTRLYFFDGYVYVDGVRQWTKHDVKIKWNKTEHYFTAERAYIKYTVDEFMGLFNKKDANGNADMHDFMYNFLYLMVPFTTQEIDLLFVKIDVREEIAKAMTSEAKPPEDPATLGSILQEYKYVTDENKVGKHTLKIGLAELAQNKSLSTLTVELEGANDGNDDTTTGVKDNYVKTANISTSFAGIANLSVAATLCNVDAQKTLENKNLTGKQGGMTNIIVRGQEYWVKENNVFTDKTPFDEYQSLAEALKGELDITGSNKNPWLTVDETKAAGKWQ